MNILKQSTAATIKLGPFIDDTDGKTAETGLTISQADIRLSKNGGDFAQKNNATGATHDEFGYYDIPLDTTDTGTLGRLRVAVSVSGALPVWQEFLVVTANVYDTLCSTDSLDVNVTALADDVITAGKFDESTAFPLKSADTGITQVARVGADSDTLETLSDEIAAVKAETALIVADTGTDGVKINATQGAITWGQQKIVANVALEGALDISNSNLTGYGQSNYGRRYGLINTGELLAGQKNQGTMKNVDGFDPALALEATLTAIKGSGWTDETLVKIITDISNISAGSGATPQQVWEYATRTLTAGTNIDLSALATAADLQDVEDKIDVIATDTTTEIPATLATLATSAALATVDTNVDSVLADTNEIQAELADGGRTDLLIDAIKAKTDVIPASPAPANEYDARMTAIQADLDNPTQYKADVSGLATQTSVNAIPTSPLLAANYTAPDNASIAAIKAKTDKLPTDPASESNATANKNTVVTAINNKPVTPETDLTGVAKSSELTPLAKSTELAGLAKTTELTPLAKSTELAGLAKTTDLSALAKETTAQAIKNQTDNLEFDGERVKASALVDLDGSDIAKQSTVEQILSMMSETPIEIAPSVIDGKITAIKGNDWQIVIPCELNEESKIQMAIKGSSLVPDEKSTLFIDSETGLLYLDGVAATAGDGALAYADGHLTLVVKASATQKIAPKSYRYGIQQISPSGDVNEKYGGVFVVSDDIVKAVE